MKGKGRVIIHHTGESKGRKSAELTESVVKSDLKPHIYVSVLLFSFELHIIFHYIKVRGIL